MVVDERLERLYEKVDLVKGAGDPSRGKLCVMSFVAFLAGESHSDQPRTASPLIRSLAIRINDAIPRAMRQELKPFVPRIIGTNDGYDAERAAMLRAAVDLEILPRVCRDFLATGASRRWRRMAEFRKLSGRLFDITHASEPPLDGEPACKLAEAIASLLCFCGAEAPDLAARRWYWEKAIEILDRACDIGEERPPVAFNAARMERLEQILVHRSAVERGKAITGRTTSYLRAVLSRAANAL
ncbi:MAG: hypothetical protein M0002_09275 [Rhodospirillales bacterium]|nr:hypothetical protein [Rhodospirillales bacterium]